MLDFLYKVCYHVRSLTKELSMKKHLSIVVSVFLAVFFLLTLGAYFDRPTVEVDFRTNSCVRAYGPHGELSCADAMRGAYERVFVDSHPRRRVEI